MTPSAPLSSRGRCRVVIVAPTAQSILNLRWALIEELRASDHKVTIVAPDIDASTRMKCDAADVLIAPFSLSNARLSLMAERQNVKALREVFEAIRPDIVLCYGQLFMVQGVRAAAKEKVPHIVAMVNGLPENRLVGGLVAGEQSARGYDKAFRECHHVVFHNHDDMRHVQALGLISGDKPCSVIPGAGVDLLQTSALAFPALSEGLVFLMVASLDRRRGYDVFCEAANAMGQVAPNARFLIAGPERDGGHSFRALLHDADSNVSYLGPSQDVRETLRLCHVFVYPSRAEGMPKLVLEAMAAGRPIVTTDIAGCRETVDERVNGVLVQRGDPASLVAAFGGFLKRPDLIPSMGRASRAKAERRFCQRHVTQQMISVLGL